MTRTNLLLVTLCVTVAVLYGAEQRKRGRTEVGLGVAVAQKDSAVARLTIALEQAARARKALDDVQAVIERDRIRATQTAATLSATAQAALQAAADSATTADSLRGVIVGLVARVVEDSIADARLDASQDHGMTIAQAKVYADSVAAARIKPVQLAYDNLLAHQPKPPSEFRKWGGRALLLWVGYQVGK